MTKVKRADVLGIFDCCDAGTLLQMRGQLRFEYLGACMMGETTQAAGKHSFTQALIWALTQFKEGGKKCFSTSELHRKIMDEAPHFPRKSQTPVLGQRFGFAGPDFITIAPEMTAAEARILAGEPGASLPWARTGAYLNLQFQFDEALTDDMLKTIAMALHDLVVHQKLSAKRIAFLGKHELKSTKWFQAVNKVIAGAYVPTPPATDGSQSDADVSSTQPKMLKTLLAKSARNHKRPDAVSKVTKHQIQKTRFDHGRNLRQRRKTASR